MREPKYKVFVEYTGKTERVTGIELNIMGKVNRIHVGHTEYIIKGDRDKFHLREFTGLKDKNGTEIYEGDLLKQRYSNKMGYEVVWRKSGFELKYDFIQKFEGESWVESLLLPIHSDSYEIVGNIYENPELIDRLKP